MERLHPGVYIQEVSSGVRPIEGVSTSTTAFVGKTQKGSIDRAELVTNFTEFQASYGDFLSDSFVAHAALQYFNNGGKRLYVARVTASAAGQGATTASVSIADRQGTPALALQVSALSPGSWANNFSITIGNSSVDPSNQFRLTVNRGTEPIEILDNLSVNPDALNFVDRAINGRSRYISVVGATSSTTTVAGTSASGAGAQTALTDVARKSLVIELNGDGPRTITLAGATTSGIEIAAAIQVAVRALTPLRASTTAATYSGFTAAFAGTTYTLTSGAAGRRSAVRVTNAPPASNAANLLRLGLANNGLEVTGAGSLRPAAGVFALSGAGVGGNVTASSSGGDGGTPTDQDLVNGLSRLDAIPDVNIVAIPGVGTAAVVDGGTGYCTQRQDCFFIGETASGDDTAAEAQTFVGNLTVKSSFGAVYFPWVKAADPTGASPTPILLPPSGYVAGIYARTDARRGVWKAPAGTEANLLGTLGLATQINDAQQDVLNPIGANVIRFFPSSGVVLWGARTLATASDAEYRYVSVRRLALFLERSIYSGIQWAVFEPNDDDLWASLRLNIGSFMMNMFRAGAFQGTTPSQGFFVKCDEENNPQSEIDAGVVNVLVGFAPVRPAEFVVIKISQKAGDSAI
jgi:phage tail sheath protein FI